MFAPISLHGAELWFVAGWTMLHFLWLGTLVGLAALACRLLLRRASADVRYVVALASLAILAALPVGIGAWLVAKPQVVDRPWRAETLRVAEVQPDAEIIELKGRETGLAAATNPPAPGSAGDFVADDRAVPHATWSNAEQANPRQTSASSVEPSRGLTDVLATLDVCVPYLPWLWLVGTPLTFALLATGVIGAERLRRASNPIQVGPIAEACARLARSLGVTRRVAVAVCERIAAPVLVGIFRPIILLPPAALTGWSPDEIEMVLLHELAHVRRWDNLINLAQRLIESLLFFHPAIWLISNWVRREREACCDAVVVHRTQRPHAYAEMLVALAAQMPRSVLFHPAASSAMAAGRLRPRIRRILRLEDDPMLVSGKSFAIVLAGLLVAGTLAVLYLPKIGQAEESATEVTEKEFDVAAEQETQKNLKRLVMALHNNHDNRGSFPANAIYDANGERLLSWRVHVLPFLAEEKLYQEFHLDEPWDSEHNRKLIARMPAVFRNPKIDEPGKTNYLAVVGKECVFDGSPKGMTIVGIPDGTAKTIALVEADADHAVEWTKPQDWQFDRRHPTAGLGSLWADHWYGAWADGSVRRIDNSEPEDAAGIQFTRAGREVHSLAESEGRGVQPGEGMFAAEGEMLSPGAATRKFPSLEDQKLADLAWKRLQLELEPIGEEDLKRVQALGYEGGVKVVKAPMWPDGIWTGDILVGLHVWPTTSLKDVAEVLNRADLDELNPLKFYVIRQSGATIKKIPNDAVVTGRISVSLGGGGRSSSQADRAGIDSQFIQALVENQLERDPQAAMLKHELSMLQMRLANMANEKNSRQYQQLERQIAAVQRQLAQYRESVEQQVLERRRDASVLNQLDNPYRIDRPKAGTLELRSETTPDQESAKKSVLRYDGKTFEEWREIWRNELSTERRLEAVKALAAFGAAGYGKEAAEAILDVAGEYDFRRSYDRDSTMGQLLSQVAGSLATGPGIDPTITFSMVMERFQASPDKWHGLLAKLLLNRPKIDASAIGQVRELLEHKDADLRAAALAALVARDPAAGGAAIKSALADPDSLVVSKAIEILVSQESQRRAKEEGTVANAPDVDFPIAEFLSLLLRTDPARLVPGGRWTAFTLARQLSAETATKLVGALTAILNDPSRAADHLAAIRAIGVMGVNASAAKPELERIFNDETADMRLRVAAAFALDSFERRLGTRSQLLTRPRRDESEDREQINKRQEVERLISDELEYIQRQ